MASCASTVLYLHLLSDLAEAVPGFSPDYDGFWPDATPSQVAAQQIKGSLLKKYLEDTAPDAEAKAWEKFCAANDKCAAWELRLKDSRDELLWGEFRNAIDSFLHPNGMPLVTCYEQILDHARTGPGACLQGRGFDFYTKLFDSPLTSTSRDLYIVYKNYLSVSDRRWSYAEDLRYDRHGDVQIVEGSRLNFAEKRVDIKRVINSVASLNMFYQLGMEGILAQRLKEVFNIDLTNQQEYNRWLAYIGSVEDSFGTADLASASDLNALLAARAFLPSDFLSWIEAIRSPKLEAYGKQVPINMVGTMGEGFTFAYMTMVFACVVAAVYRVNNIALVRNVKHGDWLWPGNFGVFGDDIIVEKSTMRDLARMLDLLGHELNRDKTFVEGPFRESCGRDYFRGRAVRGVYLKRLRTQQDRCVAINRLIAWSSVTGIPLRRTVRYLLKFTKQQLVPLYENEDAGIRAPSAYIPKPKLARNDIGEVNYNYLYQCYTPRQPAWEISAKSGLIHRNKLLRKLKGHTRHSNALGLVLTFLRGDIVSMQCVVPSRDITLYTARWKESPNWDFFEPTLLPEEPKLEEYKAMFWAVVPCKPRLICVPSAV